MEHNRSRPAGNGHEPGIGVSNSAGCARVAVVSRVRPATGQRSVSADSDRGRRVRFAGLGVGWWRRWGGIPRGVTLFADWLYTH